MKAKSQLPRVLKVKVTQADLVDAVCGSPTRCAIAKALRRQNENDVRLRKAHVYTFANVNPNRVTITCQNVLHHYALPDEGLRIVAQNDDGSLSLTSNKAITLKLIDFCRAHTGLTPERKAQIKRSNDLRRAEGKKYGPGIRKAAARRAGVASKKLAAAGKKRA